MNTADTTENQEYSCHFSPACTVGVEAGELPALPVEHPPQPSLWVAAHYCLGQLIVVAAPVLEAGPTDPGDQSRVSVSQATKLGCLPSNDTYDNGQSCTFTLSIINYLLKL